ncbi:MAG: TerC/Alx family metal homeostasis membrane protein [Bacteroidota bacterium]
MNPNEILFFSVFLCAIIGILIFDLKFVGRHSHVISFKEAGIWSAVWVSIAIVFFFILQWKGDIIHGITTMDALKDRIATYKHPINISGKSLEDALAIYRKNLSLEFLTGYLIEYSLSVDNVFVILLIFSSFNVSTKYYKRVLFWGIFGAIIMRFLFIFISAGLINRFEWVMYLFGGFLLVTGMQMYRERNTVKKIDPAKHPVVQFMSKHFRVLPDYREQHFALKEDGKWFITPLFVVLIIIEFTDVIFAVDSVPAIFSVTKDPFIVFYSNIFAILGLRSLFFLVSGMMKYFHYLKEGLAVLLMFIGLKMLMHTQFANLGFTTNHSLLVVLAILGISILLSLLFPKDTNKP